ncbi:hypothetical protein RB595_005255 [Gaeumannomyces hyphopodioides]
MLFSGSIYTGVWRNYNYGNGSTLILTVTPEVGAFLTAFIALFVSLSLGHLWSILAFILHQARSTPAPRSGLYHQRQVLLRNTSVGSMAWMSIKLAWVWRGKSPGVFRGSAVMMFVAVAFAALLVASSLLSSQIQIVGGDVLFSGQECGWCNSSAILQASAAYEDFQSWLFDRAEQFSNNECYNPGAVDGSDPSACADFPTPRIPVRTSFVPCPFSQTICAQKNALRLDTGFIDSDEHLRINSPPEDRARFRKITTCVPIETEKFSSKWSATPPDSPDPLVPSPRLGSFYKAFYLGSAGYSYTWVVGNRTQYLPSDFGSMDVPYYLQAIRSLSETRNDARYKAPVQDPWFRATERADQTGAGRPAETYYMSNQKSYVSDQKHPDQKYYMSDQTSATIACTEQYQVCNTTACSGLRGLSPLPFDYPNWGVELNHRQVAALALLHDVGYGNLGDLITKKPRLLRAFRHLSQGDTYSRWGVPSYPSKGLPPAHWQLEVSNMLHSSLAVMQLLAASLAAPPNIPMSWRDGGTGRVGSLREYLSPLRDGFGNANISGLGRTASWRTGNPDVCSRIRTRNERHINFAFAPFITILCVGAAIIVINLLCIPSAVFWLERKLNMTQLYQQREWDQGHFFMLQQAKFESEGIVGWETKEGSEIPWLPVQPSGHNPLIGSPKLQGRRASLVVDGESEKRSSIGGRRVLLAEEVHNEQLRGA